MDLANPNYSSLNGVSWFAPAARKVKSLYIRCPCGKAGNYTILGSVTMTSEHADQCQPERHHDPKYCYNLTWGRHFQYCRGLTSITLPNSKSSIDFGVWMAAPA